MYKMQIRYGHIFKKMFFLHDVEKINNVSSFVRTFWFEFFWHSLPCFLYTMSIQFCERNFFSEFDLWQFSNWDFRGWVHTLTRLAFSHTCYSGTFAKDQKIKQSVTKELPIVYLYFIVRDMYLRREISKHFCKRCPQFCKNQ